MSRIINIHTIYSALIRMLTQGVQYIIHYVCNLHNSTTLSLLTKLGEQKTDIVSLSGGCRALDNCLTGGFSAVPVG